MLDQASALCRQAYDASRSRLLVVLEPALILAVGMVVLVVALAVLRPMLDLARSAAI
jgi:type II secretory pathway component PulF